MKDNETIIKNHGEEEWYTEFFECEDCEKDFMAEDPKFCPYCGKKIIGIRTFNARAKAFTDIVYNFE